MQSTGFEFDDVFDEVIDRAGGQQSTAEDVFRVRRGIRIVLERWEASGFNTWRIRSTPVVAAGHTPWVQLPDDVDDVLHVMRETGGELTRLSPASYIQLTDKDRAGPPASYYLDRTDPPRLRLHPVGTGERLDVWYVERPADFDLPRANLDDVPGRWLEALILAVAHDFARKRPGEGGGYNEALIARLDGERREAETIARDADRPRTRYRYRIRY